MAAIDIPSFETPSAVANPDAIPKVAICAIMFGSAGVLNFPIALRPPPNGRFQASLYKAYCVLMFLEFVTGLLMLLLTLFPPGGRNHLSSAPKKLMWVAFATATLALALGLYLILCTA